MTRPTLSTRGIIAGIVMALLVLTACQDGGGGEPTRIPTAIPPTPTVRSTPLPAVSPAPALGETSARSIVVQVALFGQDAAENTRRTGNQLQQALQAELGLEVSVQFVDESTALESLCSGAPVAAWVSPFTYVQAASACDVEPVVAVTRGRPAITAGQTAEIIGRVDITDLSQLENRVFCRSFDQDFFTGWIFPSLYLAAEGVNPRSDLSAIRDFPDSLSLGKALYQGDCAAAALPPDEFEDWLIDLSAFLSTDANPVTGRELEEWMHVVQPAADTAVPRNTARWQFDRGVIPYEVLVFPPEAALPGALDDTETLRGKVAQTIQDFFSDQGTGSQRLTSLLDARGLLPVNADSYREFSTVITSANWNMVFTD